jgi:hypothetical protein
MRLPAASTGRSGKLEVRDAQGNDANWVEALPYFSMQTIVSASDSQDELCGEVRNWSHDRDREVRLTLLE